MTTSLGKTWAICDHFESETGKPVLASILKQSIGITRAELRQLERKGKLDVYYVTNEKGTLEKAYMRPKKRSVANG